MDSIWLKTKELSTFYCGNLVTITTRYVADAYCPKDNTIKIMPCVEGDRSDGQPEASSIARSRRLRAMVVVKG